MHSSQSTELLHFCGHKISKVKWLDWVHHVKGLSFFVAGSWDEKVGKEPAKR